MTATLAMIAGLEEAPSALDPRVWVEPKDRLALSEIQRQAQAVAYLRRHARRLVVFAVPNAARLAGDKLRQHREGAVYGAADLVCLWAGGVAFVEMKAGRTMPRANQVAFLNGLAARDHHVAVARTAEGLAGWLAGIGAPVPAPRKSTTPEAAVTAPGSPSPEGGATHV